MEKDYFKEIVVLTTIIVATSTSVYVYSNFPVIGGEHWEMVRLASTSVVGVGFLLIGLLMGYYFGSLWREKVMKT